MILRGALKEFEATLAKEPNRFRALYGAGRAAAEAVTARGIEVHVVAPDKVPMEKILGTDMGKFIRKLHEQHRPAQHRGEQTVPAGLVAQNLELWLGTASVH